MSKKYYARARVCAVIKLLYTAHFYFDLCIRDLNVAYLIHAKVNEILRCHVGEVECLPKNQIKSELENARVCDSTRKHSHDEVAKISRCLYQSSYHSHIKREHYHPRASNTPYTKQPP